MGLHSHTRSRIAIRWIAASALALVGLGCSAKLAPNPQAEMLPYRVGAPDQLSVSILPEPLVQESVVVRPDGMITIQLLGDVPAAGRTTDEVAAEIEERISRYKRGARVSVAVAQAASITVTVLGEVGRPTNLAITRMTRVTEALGTVGGTSWLASNGSIRVVRPSQGGTVVLPVDLSAIRSGDLTTNLVLEAGDIIYVPPTWLGRIGYAIRMLLFPFDPVFGVARAGAAAAIVP
jgi:polysaccharide export outer membrane protein